MKPLLTVAIRQGALFVPSNAITAEAAPLRHTTSVLIANMANLGYGVSEPLLHALNNAAPAFQAQVMDVLKDITGVKKNWTPLVKGWDTPTNETWVDHVVTWFANIYKTPGTKLPCGHLIPAHTFPLHRYNGCPFCGTPFEAGAIESYKQNTSQKILDLWEEQDIRSFLEDLLSSKTALDATQINSLQILLATFGVPENVQIGMKETLMCVIDFYRTNNQAEKAQFAFTSPTDILRYLWYKHTGFLQIIEPKTIIRRAAMNNRHMTSVLNQPARAKLETTARLKLKYNRQDCLMVATWLNGLKMDASKACEIMHAKRGMWVRFIRALRLAEYSRRKGFENLATLMDVFYKQEYQVWQGHVDQFRLRYDAENTFRLLKQRPGLFARSLFANMLWFGPEETSMAFAEVLDKVPARLVFTLAMYAESYFDNSNSRSVKPLGGVSKRIPANHLLSVYDGDQLTQMKEAVGKLCRIALKRRFAAKQVNAKTMFIEPVLYSMPLAIGDRSDAIQDIPAAIPGSRFAIEGSTVRLFMQWGAGLPAQHMDMDLSCSVQYKNGTTQYCAYNSLAVVGCKHSGDIRYIPDQTGTAEYIEIDLRELKANGARQLIFTCNAYQSGGITPNLVVGWMSSGYPMKISPTSGVAYDPSCVQHQVRIVNRLTKGLAFGSLDVDAGEITWLEMPFDGQTVTVLDAGALNTMLTRLTNKMSIGDALEIKARAQGLELVNTEPADEVYNRKWAANSAAVMNILLD